jgi:hypothetical protein
VSKMVGRDQPGGERMGTMAVAPEDWSTCLKGAHPAYVDRMSSWRTVGSWWTTSIDTIRAGPGCRAKAMHCCRGSSAVAAAPADKCRRYSGPKAIIRFTSDVAERSAEGRPKYQEARALAVDAEVERLILEALTPGRIALGWDGANDLWRCQPASRCCRSHQS